MAATPQLQRFRFYNDDGTEDVSTAVAAQNTNITASIAAGDALPVIRVSVQETGGTTMVSGNWRLRYSKNGAAYVAITTTSAFIQIANSPNLVNGATPTERLVGGTGTFNGKVVNNANVATVGLPANAHDELVFPLRVLQATNANGDVFDIQVQYSAADLSGGYAVTPRITASTASGQPPITGTATSTLAPLTTSSTGRVAEIGAVGKTLGALTASSAGRLAEVGTVGKTLGALTSAAAGKVSVRGTTAKALQPLTSTATGAVRLTGAATGTLAPLTGSGVGQLMLAARLGVTLAPLTLNTVAPRISVVPPSRQVIVGGEAQNERQAVVGGSAAADRVVDVGAGSDAADRTI